MIGEFEPRGERVITYTEMVECDIVGSLWMYPSMRIIQREINRFHSRVLDSLRHPTAAPSAPEPPPPPRRE